MSAKTRQKKENTRPQSLERLVAQLPEEDVRALLLEFAGQDRDIERQILLRYAKSPDAVDLDGLKDELSRMELEYTDDWGQLNRRSEADYVDALTEFLDRYVPELMRSEHLDAAFALTAEAAQQVGRHVAEVHDWGLWSVLGFCCDTWHDILAQAPPKLTAQVQKWIMDMAGSNDNVQDYLDDFMRKEFRDEDAKRRRLDWLDQELADLNGGDQSGEVSWSYEYKLNQCLEEKLNLMRTLKYPREDIQAVVRSHWEQHPVRVFWVKDLLRRRRWEEAIEVLQESKELDQSRPGWVSEESLQLIDLCHKHGMDQEYKNELVFYMFHGGPERMTCARNLREVCTQEEWEAFREQILQDKRCQSIWYPLMAEEGLYRRLLDAVRSANRIEDLDRYESLLKEHYPSEIRDFYAGYVQEHAAPTTNRAEYERLVQYLKKIRDYPGGEETCGEIARSWRTRYKNRRAMMEELSRAGF